MLIGHLPAGYLASTAALDRAGVREGLRRRLLTAALIGSVAPDLDLFYFYGVDSGVHHHALVPHWPVLWLGVLAAGWTLVGARRRATGWGAVAFGAGGMLHLMLDSIAGSVRWLAPFSQQSLTLVTVPATSDSWILSFVTHWTFGVEVALTVVAVAVWVRRRGTPPRRTASGVVD